MCFLYLLHELTEGGSHRSNFAVDAELERNLQPETPVAQRCKTLRELGDAVKANKLEDVNCDH